MTNNQIKQKLVEEYGEDKVMLFSQMIAKYHSFRAEQKDSTDDEWEDAFFWNDTATTMLEDKIKQYSDKK